MKESFIHASGAKRILALFLLCVVTVVPAFSQFITEGRDLPLNQTISVQARPENEETLTIIPLGVAESGKSFVLDDYLGATLPVGKILMTSNSADPLTLTVSCIYNMDKTGARFYSQTTGQSFSYEAYLRDNATVEVGAGMLVGNSVTVTIPQNTYAPTDASYWLDVKLPEQVSAIAANDYHTALQVMVTKI